jgi:hypothetical protein
MQSVSPSQLEGVRGSHSRRLLQLFPYHMCRQFHQELSSQGRGQFHDCCLQEAPVRRSQRRPRRKNASSSFSGVKMEEENLVAPSSRLRYCMFPPLLQRRLWQELLRNPSHGWWCCLQLREDPLKRPHYPSRKIVFVAEKLGYCAALISS